jgi:hypothetical protein
MAELFQSYEARQRTRTGRRVLAWLAASIALHLSFVVTVVYVPALQSALQIASIFNGMEYGDEDYERTTLDGAAVTYVRTSDFFQYPAGYFSKIKPTDLSGATVQTTPTVKPTPAPTPRPTPSPVATPLPSPSATPAPAASPSPAGGATETTAKVDEEAKPEPSPESVQDTLKALPKINSRPFTDFIRRTKTLVDEGKFELNVLQVSVEADVTADGRLTNFKGWQFNPNSPQHQKLAREFVAMISDSRGFSYLQGATHVKISGRLDSSTVSARVTAAADSAELAARKASGYNLLLAGVKIARRGKNEEVFLQNTRINAAGSNIQIEMRMPRKLANEVIAKQVPAG